MAFHFSFSFCLFVHLVLLLSLFENSEPPVVKSSIFHLIQYVYVSISQERSFLLPVTIENKTSEGENSFVCVCKSFARTVYMYL